MNIVVFSHNIDIIYQPISTKEVFEPINIINQPITSI